MSMPPDAMPARPGRAVLELATRDALAAVRHVTALLVRRAYPLLALACLPAAGGSGRLVVAVADDGRVPRLAVELAHLPEVSSARLEEWPLPDLAALLGEAPAA